ncbi:MAG: MopE-related protein [Polyangiales bacterium]
MTLARRTPDAPLLLSVAVALLAACANDDARAPSAITSAAPSNDTVHAIVPGSCVDRDGDGYGAGCARGPDCDDSAPQVTRECLQCRRPDVGCACDPAAPPVPCNLATGTTENAPDGVCHLGQRVCRHGAWSACEAFEGARGARLFGVVSPCFGQCDPTCQHIVDCVTADDAMPAGSVAVEPSDLAQAVYCPAGTPVGGVQPACERRPGGPYLRSVSPLPWVDACAQPGAVIVLASADEGVATVAIPFAFSYWGVAYRTVSITPNGVAEFTAASSQWANTTLPSPSTPNAVLAFWDDLVLRGGVCVATVGAAPDRRTVLQWNDAAFYPAADASTHLTFEVVLSEASQTVDVLYDTMQGAPDLSSGSSATIGVQEGGGTRFDLVGYNTPGVANAGTGFRWSPISNDAYCVAGVYRRTFEASCPAGSVATIPTWGRLNVSTRVPGGAAIRMEARAADSAAELASAPAIRLPDAPRSTDGTAITSSYELGDILTAASQHLGHARLVELTAYLDPGPDENLAPTLGAIEMQFRCGPVETPFRCDAGSPCVTSGVCRRGAISCDHPLTPVCVDVGPLPVGTACGVRQVCDGSGACVACDEGATCDLGNACQFGRISCATGSPVCERVRDRPAGTTCAFGTGAYVRESSSLGWIDACAAQGSTRLLAAARDGIADVTLPFPFTFYGTARTQAGVSVNGVMGFATASPAWVNAALAATELGDAIAPFWDDLQTRPAGICVATFGRAPGRLFVAQWSGVDLEDRGTVGDLGASLNFEVVLEEATQAIDVIYGDMVGNARASGESATVGIQRGDGASFDQVSFDTIGSVRANSAIRWRPPVESTCDGAGACVPCAASETCDGRDNNCNALVDEGFADISCGVGACRRTVAGCVRGVVPTCTPGAPTSEVCNGLDDDCDGDVDEACAGTITCPADASMFAGDARAFTVTTGGVLRGLTWAITSAPAGGDTSARWTPSPAASATETFAPLIVGDYRVQVAGVDGLGVTRSCAFTVRAASRGIRVELTWNGTGDLDLHMHNNVSGAWFDGVNDCHYANMTPAWGAAQDVDSVSANGPENIRLNAPVTGQTYTVGVHNYARGAGRTATVKVYCGASSTTPAAVLVSVPLAGTAAGNCTANTFWKVADVSLRADGTCLVTPLATYVPSSSACLTR